MPRIALLQSFDLDSWTTAASKGERAGTLGPYGLEHLAQMGWDLRWRRPTLGWALEIPGARRAIHLAERRQRTGVISTLEQAPVLARSEAAISIFEDNGLCLAWLRSLGFFKRLDHYFMTCWLADTMSDMDSTSLQRLQEILSTTRLVTTFSRAQADVLRQTLGQGVRVEPIPFGVDIDFFSANGRPIARARDFRVLTVGRDRSRDYSTFVTALLPLPDISVHMQVHPSTITGVNIPSHWTVDVGQVGHLRYRQLLAASDLVVVPTTAPLYPAGQTVLFEAMSMGIPCVATDSASMREYLTSEEHLLLVPPRDAAALRDAVTRLKADVNLRERLALSGMEKVRASFRHDVMWSSLSNLAMSSL